MQIIIPMSGFGERFRNAGYNIPKPLIIVEGKPIIAHVIDMFPGEKNFLFICNKEHLENPLFDMENTLKKFCPTGIVYGISSHKLGPIFSVRQAENLIDMKKPVIVNYCDFSCYWDWNHFKKFVSDNQCDGAIPAYRGFHPHTLGCTNYAYMQEKEGWIQDIQEKNPYTNNRMEEYASSGTYYFSSGNLMKESFRTTMELDINLGGEFYVSLAYKSLLVKNKKIAVYPLQHFMQWGTPEDLNEYNNWSLIFRRLIKPKEDKKEIGSTIIPMAGLGMRFVNEGYVLPKPLIPVSGKPMVVQAVNDLPKSSNYSFVLRGDMPHCKDISKILKSTYKNAVIKIILNVTEGQACTGLLGLDELTSSLGEESGPFTFAACDNGVLFDSTKLSKLLEDPEVDVIVWSIRGNINAIRNPEMYGWIDSKNKLIHHISVKKPLKSPDNDPIVIGTFTFKRANDFRNATKRLINRNGKINGEYYIDSCINDAIDLGLNCVQFEVDHFINWGTPDDLRTFEYWQSCFHKWSAHPYSLEEDHTISKQYIHVLSEKYKKIIN